MLNRDKDTEYHHLAIKERFFKIRSLLPTRLFSSNKHLNFSGIDYVREANGGGGVQSKSPKLGRK